MSTKIEYNDKVITFTEGDKIEIHCKDRKMVSDLLIETERGVDVSGELLITENGEADVTGYATVNVAVPIPDGYVKPTGSLDITENGTENVSGKAEVNVNIQPKLQEKTATENGEVTPDEGYDGLSKVTVNVPGPSLESIEVTENGTYTAADGKAYNEVKVNVHTGKPIEVESEEAMDSILANATDSSVGSIYKYTGESTTFYEKNALYVIEEAVSE